MTEVIQEAVPEMFLSVNYFCAKSLTKKRNYFERSPLGLGTLPRYVKNECDAVGVDGEGVRKHMTAHGLQATCITFLFEAWFQFQVIDRQTGHRDPRSAFAYENTDTVLEKQLKANMIGAEIGEGKIGVGKRQLDEEDLKESKKKVRVQTAGPPSSGIVDLQPLPQEIPSQKPSSTPELHKSMGCNITGPWCSGQIGVFSNLSFVGNLTANIYQNLSTSGPRRNMGGK